MAEERGEIGNGGAPLAAPGGNGAPLASPGPAPAATKGKALPVWVWIVGPIVLFMMFANYVAKSRAPQGAAAPPAAMAPAQSAGTR